MPNTSQFYRLVTCHSHSSCQTHPLIPTTRHIHSYLMPNTYLHHTSRAPAILTFVFPLLDTSCYTLCWMHLFPTIMLDNIPHCQTFSRLHTAGNLPAIHHPTYLAIPALYLYIYYQISCCASHLPALLTKHIHSPTANTYAKSLTAARFSPCMTFPARYPLIYIFTTHTYAKSPLTPARFLPHITFPASDMTEDCIGMVIAIFVYYFSINNINATQILYYTADK